jgi:hypothetical protein
MKRTLLSAVWKPDILLLPPGEAPDETYPPERCLEAGYPIIAARRNVTEPYAW